MAMNNGSYGYSSSSGFSSSFSTPYSSTSLSMRSQRPRFGYSNVPSYPRPRSSASKPNPDIYSDNMRDSYGNSDSLLDSMHNNYGSPDVHMTDSYNSEPYNDSSLLSQSASSYYPGNDSYYDSLKYPVGSGQGDNYLNSPMARNSQSLQDTSPLLNLTPMNQYSPNKFQNQNAYFGMNSGNGGFQKQFSRFNQNVGNIDSSPAGKQKKKFGQANKGQTKNFGKIKNPMASKIGCRCNLCGIDFTSNIPYEMHLRGSRHAKKLKTIDAASSVQQGTRSKDVSAVGTTFRCEACNVIANSPQQLQTHLDGTKHKNKLILLQNPDAKINGKSNGTTRSLPSEFGEPQPSKLLKLSCDICSISVNSDAQLQQHLISKKHQAKVEGKPLEKKKPKAKKTDPEAMDDTPEDGAEPATAANASEGAKTVVGVKTLSSSFVQGGTLA